MESSEYIEKVGEINKRLIAINDARRALAVFEKLEVMSVLNQLDGMERQENENLISVTREFKTSPQNANYVCEGCNFKKSCLKNGCYGDSACPGIQNEENN